MNAHALNRYTPNSRPLFPQESAAFPLVASPPMPPTLVGDLRKRCAPGGLAHHRARRTPTPGAVPGLFPQESARNVQVALRAVNDVP